MFDPAILHRHRRRLRKKHTLELVEASYAFIYSGSGEFTADLYLIFVGDGSTTVHHQYDCCSCQQFEAEKCALVALNGPRAVALNTAMGCNADADVILPLVQHIFPGATIEKWVREALIWVSHPELGDFQIACCNCDRTDVSDQDQSRNGPPNQPGLAANKTVNCFHSNESLRERRSAAVFSTF